ncbi:MAG TPA: Asp-tRNA(Asn)/Glu-tRNA(Gln) amidotransferase subunit GatC [Terriglobales bacterium]|nr:Asp-tRNA(Asn)/Glu-tRNA(Gln) amidotransferase subunit GatC [Terriglobales bacterium]
MKVNVSDVAVLANLDLTPEEIAALERDLNSVLDYVAQLGQIDTEGVPPMSHALLSHAPLRDDQVHPWFSVAEALSNAPAQGAGMFEVPKILERG